MRTLAEKLETRVDNEQEVLDTTLRENQKEIDRRLDELTRRMNALEAKAAKQDGKLKREKNLISQLTLLAGIIAGAWVIVTVLNLFQ